MDNAVSRAAVSGGAAEQVPAEHLKMYDDIAEWFHLLTPPEDYAVEAAFYSSLIDEFADGRARRVLELGSGGGNNASHLKHRYEMTLVDLSARMLDLSRTLNPECEHVRGDMRDVRLGLTFDAVFVHDAIVYMVSEADLGAALRTAFEHCRPGGVAVFAPDVVREEFAERTEHGGSDAGARGMRYLEWVWDPDPTDDWYVGDYAYLIREADGSVRSIYDRHVCGLFDRATWLRLMEEAGFVATNRPGLESETGPDVFVGVRPAAG